MDKLQVWADFLWEVRGFFRSQGFLEVFTPIAVICPGTEPSIEPFRTELRIGRGHRELFLRTSPELKIKRLLSETRPRLFEMGPVFRNEEATDLHEPEFWMLEWYREHSQLNVIQDDVEKLVKTLVQKFSVEKSPRIIRTTIRELFRNHLGLEPTSSWGKREYQLAVEKLGLSQNLTGTAMTDSSALWSQDDFFFFLLGEVEKKMDPNVVYFVSEYPPFQAAYARIQENGWAGRFEVYWAGMELANAFWEVVDPQIQRERFISDIDKKKQTGKTTVPLDEEFLAYLQAGNIKSASGIALGLERLFMALTGTKTIQEIKTFPYSDLL